MNTYLHIVCNASVRGHGRSLVRAAAVSSALDPGRRELSGTSPARAPLPQAGRGDDNGQQQPETAAEQVVSSSKSLPPVATRQLVFPPESSWIPVSERDLSSKTGRRRAESSRRNVEQPAVVDETTTKVPFSGRRNPPDSPPTSLSSPSSSKARPLDLARTTSSESPSAPFRPRLMPSPPSRTKSPAPTSKGKERADPAASFPPLLIEQTPKSKPASSSLPPKTPDRPGTTLRIQNLPTSRRDREIVPLIEHAAGEKVLKFRQPHFKSRGTLRPYAFAVVETEEGMKRAAVALHGSFFDGVRIEVRDSRLPRPVVDSSDINDGVRFSLPPAEPPLSLSASTTPFPTAQSDSSFPDSAASFPLAAPSSTSPRSSSRSSSSHPPSAPPSPPLTKAAAPWVSSPRAADVNELVSASLSSTPPFLARGSPATSTPPPPPSIASSIPSSAASSSGVDVTKPVAVEYHPGTKLIIRNLPRTLRARDIVPLVAQAAGEKVLEFTQRRYENKGKLKFLPYAFAVVESEEGLKKAVAALDGSFFDGRRIEVQEGRGSQQATSVSDEPGVTSSSILTMHPEPAPSPVSVSLSTEPSSHAPISSSGPPPTIPLELSKTLFFLSATFSTPGRPAWPAPEMTGDTTTTSMPFEQTKSLSCRRASEYRAAAAPPLLAKQTRRIEQRQHETNGSLTSLPYLVATDFVERWLAAFRARDIRGKRFLQLKLDDLLARGVVPDAAPARVLNLKMSEAMRWEGNNIRRLAEGKPLLPEPSNLYLVVKQPRPIWPIDLTPPEIRSPSDAEPSAAPADTSTIARPGSYSLTAFEEKNLRYIRYLTPGELADIYSRLRPFLSGEGSSDDTTASSAHPPARPRDSRRDLWLLSRFEEEMRRHMDDFHARVVSVAVLSEAADSALSSASSSSSAVGINGGSAASASPAPSASSLTAGYSLNVFQRRDLAEFRALNLEEKRTRYRELVASHVEATGVETDEGKVRWMHQLYLAEIERTEEEGEIEEETPVVTSVPFARVEGGGAASSPFATSTSSPVTSAPPPPLRAPPPHIRPPSLSPASYDGYPPPLTSEEQKGLDKRAATSPYAQEHSLSMDGPYPGDFYQPHSSYFHRQFLASSMEYEQLRRLEEEESAVSLDPDWRYEDDAEGRRPVKGPATSYSGEAEGTARDHQQQEDRRMGSFIRRG